MFVPKAHVEAWPMAGPLHGQPVTFFHPVGPFVVTKVATTFVVQDSRLANSHGGPQVGLRFSTSEAAQAFITEGV